jgi:hypothetical protein
MESSLMVPLEAAIVDNSWSLSLGGAEEQHLATRIPYGFRDWVLEMGVAEVV